jgi:hypothetical protein
MAAFAFYFVGLSPAAHSGLDQTAAYGPREIVGLVHVARVEVVAHEFSHAERCAVRHDPTELIRTQTKSGLFLCRVL